MTAPALTPRAPDAHVHVGGFTRTLGKLVTIEPDEMRATFLAFLYFFFLLAGYFVLRSIRRPVITVFSSENLLTDALTTPDHRSRTQHFNNY